jgi:hypothetical protein
VSWLGQGLDGGALGIHSTLAALTLITLSVEMLKISNFFKKNKNKINL